MIRHQSQAPDISNTSESEPVILLTKKDYRLIAGRRFELNH